MQMWSQQKNHIPTKKLQIQSQACSNHFSNTNANVSVKVQYEEIFNPKADPPVKKKPIPKNDPSTFTKRTEV